MASIIKSFKAKWGEVHNRLCT
ncbi:g166 [Yersinia phage phiR1-37]|nr:hypothetical protein phiR1-37_gp166 [Yersinia phage phiR1-37]CCE26190.1 g166 [Yersinia phage phiR1-37]